MYIHLLLQVEVNPVISSSWLVILSFICAYVYLFIYNPLIHSQSLKWIMRLGSCWLAIHTLSCPYVHLFNSVIYSFNHWSIDTFITLGGSEWRGWVRVGRSAEPSAAADARTPVPVPGTEVYRRENYFLVSFGPLYISYLN